MTDLIKNNYELPIIAWLNYNRIGANSEILRYMIEIFKPCI